jgi:hypothetical protein
MGAVAGLLHLGTVAVGLLPAVPPEPVESGDARRGADGTAGRAAWVQAFGGDRPGDRLAAFGAGAGGRWAGGVPVFLRAGGRVADLYGAGGAGGGAGGHAARGGVRVRPGRRGCRSRCSSPAAATMPAGCPGPGPRTCAGSCAGTRNRTGSMPRRWPASRWPIRAGCSGWNCPGRMRRRWIGGSAPVTG